MATAAMPKPRFPESRHRGREHVSVPAREEHHVLADGERGPRGRAGRRMSGPAPWRRYSPRGLAWRVFATAWIVFTLHFATDIVREHYPAWRWESVDSLSNLQERKRQTDDRPYSLNPLSPILFMKGRTENSIPTQSPTSRFFLRLMAVLFLFLPAASFAVVAQAARGQRSRLAFFFFIGAGFVLLQLLFLERFRSFFHDPLKTALVVNFVFCGGQIPCK